MKVGDLVRLNPEDTWVFDNPEQLEWRGVLTWIDPDTLDCLVHWSHQDSPCEEYHDYLELVCTS